MEEHRSGRGGKSVGPEMRSYTEKLKGLGGNTLVDAVRYKGVLRMAIACDAKPPRFRAQFVGKYRWRWLGFGPAQGFTAPIKKKEMEKRGPE